MDIGPVLPGRIPASLMGTRLNSALQANQQQLQLLQDQVSTGQKFFLPSDSPAAALRTIALQSLMERKQQLTTNIQSVQGFLNLSDQSLSDLSDALNQAKGFILQGTGSISTPAEKQAMALQVDALIKQLTGSGNAQYLGKYLFGGTSSNAPFVTQADGTVVFQGNLQSTDSFIGLQQALSNNVTAQQSFGATSTPLTKDINPAATLNTQLGDLLGGRGITPGSIQVTLDNGGTPQTATIDLSDAKTLQDVKTRLEAAFSGGPLTLSVAINPAKNGLVLTPSAGTVAVTDLNNTTTASDLGIAHAPAATITGTDVDPRITLTTKLSDLNGGAGITATSAGGLKITVGTVTKVVDVSSAVTVQDLFNTLQRAGLNLDTQINSAGNGLEITSRTSGADFSIGENGETTAADLGIRTFDTSTALSKLNYGNGVPVDSGTNLEVTRRDGSKVSISLAGSITVQDVIDKINAVDPGHLVASFKSVGNGLQITDDSGTGALTIDNNSVSSALGINGSETTANPANPLSGKDVNPQEVKGALNILIRLRNALNAGDDATLGRLDKLVDNQIQQVNLARGDVAVRQKTLDSVNGALSDQEVLDKDQLSKDFDVDLTEVITTLAFKQASYEATLKIASQLLQMSLTNYL
ncbi:MAG: hypothetical protein U0903_00290 [Planctomycetales bacterium]